MESEGKKVITHTADDNEFKQKLVEKLIEESNEFRLNPSCEVIADVLEVIYEICNCHNLDISIVE